MYLNKTRSFSRRIRHFDGFITDNPVLSLGLALPFVIAASNSLQAAVCILAGIAAVTLPMLLLSCLLGRVAPAWLMPPVYVLCAGCILIPLEKILTRSFPVIINTLGVYFPIIAVNTLMLYFCAKCARRGGVLQTLRTAIMQLCGFAAVMVVMASLREIFGNGSLWGVPIPGITFRLGGLLIPFAGCILAAFAAAAAKFFGRLFRLGLYRSDLRGEQMQAGRNDGGEDERRKIR